MKQEIKRLGNMIASLPAIEGGHPIDDNIGMALIQYFEQCPECPEDDVNDETGWSEWAEEKANNAIDRIVLLMLNETT